MNVAQPLVQASLLGEAIDPGPALVFVADEDMRYVAVNQAACDALGYTREELLGLRLSDVAPELDTAGRIELLRKDGSVLEVDYRTAHTTVAQMPFDVLIAFPV